MSTYNYPGPLDGPAHGLDLDGLLRLTDGFIEALHAEYPGLVPCGEVIREALEEAAGDGGPPNRGRIRSALETLSIGASAGTVSLAYTQQLVHLLDL